MSRRIAAYQPSWSVSVPCWRRRDALCTGSVASADTTDDLVSTAFAIGGYTTLDLRLINWRRQTTPRVPRLDPFDLDVYQGPMGSTALSTSHDSAAVQGGLTMSTGPAHRSTRSTHSTSSVPTPAWLPSVVRPPRASSPSDVRHRRPRSLSLDSAGAFDNYLVGFARSLTYDLDIFSAARDRTHPKSCSRFPRFSKLA